jgi:hypothetical protein
VREVLAGLKRCSENVLGLHVIQAQYPQQIDHELLRAHCVSRSIGDYNGPNLWRTLRGTGIEIGAGLSGGGPTPIL